MSIYHDPWIASAPPYYPHIPDYLILITAPWTRFSICSSHSLRASLCPLFISVVIFRSLMQQHVHKQRILNLRAYDTQRIPWCLVKLSFKSVDQTRDLPKGPKGAISGWAARASSAANLYKYRWSTSLVKEEAMLICQCVRSRWLTPYHFVRSLYQFSPLIAGPFSSVSQGTGYFPKGSWVANHVKRYQWSHVILNFKILR